MQNPMDYHKSANWTPAEESALIHFLAEQQAQMTDGSGFKGATWSKAAEELEKQGFQRDSSACSSKWTRVC
jgi:hypothetical protein